MKENISSNNSSTKNMRKNVNYTLYTEKKPNSAFRIVVPDMETMLCCETLAPSSLDKELVNLGKNYKNEFKTHFDYDQIPPFFLT